jgi:hypothetical protein
MKRIVGDGLRITMMTKDNIDAQCCDIFHANGFRAAPGRNASTCLGFESSVYDLEGRQDDRPEDMLTGTGNDYVPLDLDSADAAEIGRTLRRSSSGRAARRCDHPVGLHHS